MRQSSLRMITHQYQRPNFGGGVRLDEYISDLNLEISPEGYSCKPMCKDGFAYMWAGAKATYGIRKGKVCFEVKVAENLEVSTADFTDIHVVRVGWSTDAATLQLGEDKNSFGYGGTAKKSESRKFSDYGRRFDKGDVIGCYLAIENGWADISYCVNGRHCGSAFKVRWNAEEALFPHVLSKNCRLEVNFGQAPNPYFSLLPGFKLIDHIPVAMRIPAVFPPPNKRSCEVIMMVGLPGVGKSTWAMNYSKIHPSKKYNILGTDAIIDKMRVQGLPRKNNFGGRWDVLIKQASECFNVLLKKASLCPRNLILDQTNVYASARKRKVSQYKDAGYAVNAMVLVPTDEDMLRRSRQRTLEEGKEVPEAAVYDMKANFSLPHENENLFNNITFLELQRKEAETLVMQYNSDANLKGYKSNKRSGVGVNENQRERSDSDLRFASWHRQQGPRRHNSPEVVERARESRYIRRDRSRDSRELSPTRNIRSNQRSTCNKYESTDKGSSARIDHRKREDRSVECGPPEKHHKNSSYEDHNNVMNLPSKKSLDRSGNGEVSGIGGVAYRQQNAALSKRSGDATYQSSYEGNTFSRQKDGMHLPQNDGFGSQQDVEWEYLSQDTKRSDGASCSKQHAKKVWDDKAYSGTSNINTHDSWQNKNFDEKQVFAADRSYQDEIYSAHISVPQNRQTSFDEQSMFGHNMKKQLLDNKSTPYTPHSPRDEHETGQENIATGSGSWIEKTPSRGKNWAFSDRKTYSSLDKRENFHLSNKHQHASHQGQTEYKWNDEVNTRETASSEMHKNAEVYAFEDARKKDRKIQDFYKTNIPQKHQEYFKPQDGVYKQRYKPFQKNLHENRQPRYGTSDDGPYYSERANKKRFNQQPDFMQSPEERGYASIAHSLDAQSEIDRFIHHEGYAKKPSLVKGSYPIAESRKPAVGSNKFINLQCEDSEREVALSYDPMRGDEFFSDSSKHDEFDRVSRNLYQSGSDKFMHRNKNEISQSGDNGIKSCEMTVDHQHQRENPCLTENIASRIEKQKRFTMYDNSEEPQDADWTTGPRRDLQRNEHCRKSYSTVQYEDDDLSDSNLSKLSSLDYDNLKASLANIRQAQQEYTVEMPDLGNCSDSRESKMQRRAAYSAREYQVDKIRRDENLIRSESVGRISTRGRLPHRSPPDNRLHDAPHHAEYIHSNSLPLPDEWESQQQKETNFTIIHGGSIPPCSDSTHSLGGRRPDMKSSNTTKLLPTNKRSEQRMQSYHVDNTSEKLNFYRKHDEEDFHSREERTGDDHQHDFSRERKRLRDIGDEREMRGYSARISKGGLLCVGQDGKYLAEDDEKTKKIHTPKFSRVKYAMDFEADVMVNQVNESDEWDQAKAAKELSGKFLDSASSTEMVKSLPSLLDIPVQNRPGLLGAHPSSLHESNSFRADHAEVPILREMPIMRIRRPRGALLETPRLDINLELGDESVPDPQHLRAHSAPRPSFGLGQRRFAFPPPGIRDTSHYSPSTSHYSSVSEPLLRSSNRRPPRRPLRYSAGRGIGRIKGQEQDMLGKTLLFRGDGNSERMQYRGADPRSFRPVRPRFPLGHGLVGRMTRNRMGSRPVSFGMRLRGPRARFDR